jgi:hypothetical protein
MSLKDQLQSDLKQAMRDKHQLRMNTIRNVRAAILNKEVERGGEIDDDGVLGLIRGLCKQRDDAIEQYTLAGRDDLAATERDEKAVLEAYLPAAPDAATVEAAVSAVIAELGADGMKDMGRVMKEARARLGPAVDGKLVSTVVRTKLT